MPTVSTVMAASMKRTFLYSKIHRATVTDADLDYEGSVSIDLDLVDAAGLMLNERVEIYNVTNGNRLATYVIEGTRGSGMIQINGAAAHLMTRGDIVIIAAYCELTAEEAATHVPRVVLVDEKNRVRNAQPALTAV
jgi:aspartate 1-decarboxylase